MTTAKNAIKFCYKNTVIKFYLAEGGGGGQVGGVDFWCEVGGREE